MNFVYKKYKEITFPVRDCEFTHNEKTIRRYIGSEVMSGLLFNEDGSFCDSKAEYFDSEIAYYVPHDELLRLSDEEMLNYIRSELDSDIDQDF